MGWVRENGLHYPDDAIAAVKTRTLVVNGKEDKVVPIEQAFEFLQLLENSTGYLIPHCRHWAMIEYPELFTKVCLDFFNDPTDYGDTTMSASRTLGSRSSAPASADSPSPSPCASAAWTPQIYETHQRTPRGRSRRLPRRERLALHRAVRAWARRSPRSRGSPPALIYRDGRDGHVIARHAGTESGAFGAPGWGIHRADLQQILADAVGRDRIHLGKEITAYRQEGDEVTIELRRRHAGPGRSRRRRGRRPVRRPGADDRARRQDLHRPQRLPRSRAQSRTCPSLPDPETIQFWIGPGRAPAALPDRWRRRRHQLPARQADALGQRRLDRRRRARRAPAALRGLAPRRHRDDQRSDLRPSLGPEPPSAAVAPGTTAASCCSGTPRTRWSRTTGRAPTSPSRTPSCWPAASARPVPTGIDDAIAAYQDQRLVRTARVQKASYVTADVLHLPDGDEATAAQRQLASTAWMHGQLDWIHSFNADPNFDKVDLA